MWVCEEARPPVQHGLLEPLLPCTMDPWLAVPLANLGWVAASKAAAVVWLSLLSSLVTSVRGQGLYTLDMNDKAGEGIYVATFQVLLLAYDLA